MGACSSYCAPVVVKESTGQDGPQPIDSEMLFELVQSVEGRPKEQDALFEELQTQGACMIVTVGLDEPDDLRMFTTLRYLRALFAMQIWNNSVMLVKSDANRFFIFATSAGKAFKAAVSMKLLVSKFDTWVGEVCPELGPLPRPANLKAGIHHGGLLLLEGDCYGDPVNTASKIGEDLAQPNEIMVSSASAHNEHDDDMKESKLHCTLNPKKTEISGLTLDYFMMEVSKPEAIVPDKPTLPTKAAVEAHLKVAESKEMTTKELVILTTDMSGFTRLTKQYGILHFLRLVLSTRAIMLPEMAKVGGWLVKYEGDNIIAAFPNVDVVISCVKACVEKIADYNKSREKDFQVRIGFGLDFGEVHFLGHDIVGSAFERSFRLAEDIAEVGEVLVTERIKSTGWPSTQSSTKLSEERTLEGGGGKYYVLSFV